MTKNKLPVILIIIIVVILLSNAPRANWPKTKLPLLAIFQPEGHSIRQFTTRPDTFNDVSWRWIDTHPLTLSFSSAAIIGDYKIITSQTWRGTKYGEYYCGANTCSGKPTSLDQYGCQQYKGLEAEQQVCDKSCSGRLVCSVSCDYPSGCINPRAECGCNGRLGDPCGNGINCFVGTGDAYGNVKTFCQFETICGGRTRDILYSSERVCWAKADIYYKEQLIKTLDWSDARQSAHINQNKITIHLGERLHVDIKTESQYIGGECMMVVNDYILLFKPDDFILNLTTPKAQAFEDEPISAQIHIINNYGETVKGKLIINFEVPTIIGSAKKIEEKIIDIPTGESVHNFMIPTTQIADKVIVSPRIDILMSGLRLSGVNGICYGQELTQYPSKDQSLGGCEFVKIGSTIEETFTLNIIPKPLYLQKLATEQCIIGYTENIADKTLCVRDDIKHLSCTQLGCPKLEGHNYQCTSSGFCAETIFVDKKCLIDATCPSGTKCESSSGLCIKTEIYNNIIQCEMPDDCVTPCPEITKTCVDNKCQYRGVCSTKTEKEIVFVNITKTEFKTEFIPKTEFKTEFIPKTEFTPPAQTKSDTILKVIGGIILFAFLFRIFS